MTRAAVARGYVNYVPREGRPAYRLPAYVADALKWGGNDEVEQIALAALEELAARGYGAAARADLAGRVTP